MSKHNMIIRPPLIPQVQTKKGSQLSLSILVTAMKNLPTSSNGLNLLEGFFFTEK